MSRFAIIRMVILGVGIEHNVRLLDGFVIFLPIQGRFGGLERGSGR